MTRLSLYDPFAEVFPELFRGSLGPVNPQSGKALDVRIDVKESEKEYTVHAEVPGIDKDEIHVQIDGNRVSISAEVKKQDETREGERVLRSERYYGAVSRSFSLASEIDEDAAGASYDKGVLTLTLPKKAANGSKRLKIV